LRARTGRGQIIAILIGRNDRVIVQGITGTVGSNFARRLQLDGTTVVGGVTPGKAGQRVEGLPVYDTVNEARIELGATASFVTVPPAYVKDAVLEALDADLPLIVVYTELTPIHDALEMCRYAQVRGAVLLGPNSAGCISPGRANLSDLSDSNLRPGRIGIVSKSGTMTYEAINEIERAGFGESTVVCLGGDSVVGTTYAGVLERFEDDPETDAVVLLGEIGGQAEVRAAAVISGMRKPVIAYVSGSWAPKDKRMGHAGAIILQGSDTAEAKIEALRAAGAVVADQITQVGVLVARAIAVPLPSPTGQAQG
jgi:succinyl-CoA synthetase alpha subunit